ncbi:MAG TPA: serine/threonine-protein kinase [Polyangia bacterium]|nr:serine/threonine-protein kinase [Polyangia bacterium]
MGTVDSYEIKPEKFGRYVLLDRIGAGGMAEVFRAVMPGVEGFQRTFVVKRILGERAKSPYFVDMFVQEARINALLHHPNIVQVFDFGNVGGTYFLAMEYVRGRDVSELLRRLRNCDRPCPVAIATFIAHEVAVALGYAHALTGADGTPLHIVHRDISPSNIICLRTGGVKLLDFGIAKAIGEPEVEKTGHGMFKGKLSYIAPERIKDLPVDGRSDLFSLGVVLWELLAGQKLFRGKSDLQTLKNVAEMEIPAPSALRPDVPPELDRIVLRALARDPAERYPSGQALADDLDRVLELLHHQTRALPDLLHEVYGAELSSRQIPNTALTSELLAACAAETSNVSAGGPTYPAGQLPSSEDEYSISIGTAVPVRPKPGPMSWAAATIGTAALVLLAFGRGGGGRSQAAPGATAPPIVAPAAAPEAAPPPAPQAEAPIAPVAATPPPAVEAAPAQPAAKPARHAHYSGKGRIARGLSVDPFAEAASRGGK